MNVKLGEIIKSLRLRDGRTQEDLANAVGVSCQAVSRWELVASYPDIELIPSIANYFNVSTDELFGMKTGNAENEIAEICKSAENKNSVGYPDEAIQILRNGLALYPSSYKIMQLLSEYLYCNMYIYSTEKQKKDAVEEATLLAEKVIEECKDIEIKSMSICCLCDIYNAAGRTQKAVLLAETLPSISKYHVLRNIYTGTKKVELLKEYGIDNISRSLLDMKILADCTLDDETHAFSDDEKQIIYDKLLKIYEILFDKEDHNFFAQFPALIYLSKAQIFADAGDKENTVVCLKNYVKFGKIFASYDETAKQTSLPFNGVVFGGWVKKTPNGVADYLKEMQRDIEDARFDFVRDRSDFPTI